MCSSWEPVPCVCVCVCLVYEMYVLWVGSVCSVSMCTCRWCEDMSVHGVLLCVYMGVVQAGECSSLQFKVQALNQIDLYLNPISALSHNVT